MTRYISTRGPGTPQTFEQALLSGMAPDGGLYIPDTWPTLDRQMITTMHGLAYSEIAFQVIRPFVGDSIPAADLKSLLDDAYHGGGFHHPAVAPLVQVGPNAWLLELFHGPTLSFKDYALQLLGRLFDYVLERKGTRMTIVGATSGDTGSAAIEACKGCRNIDIFILHPQGRVSEVQRRQMTSVDEDNVFNIAIDGTFDDCQALVKAMFADEALRRDLNLSAVNSINWARIMAQTVYYVAAAAALGAPERAISFTVPTGNFGNVYAGWAARHMGLPVQRLGIASNRNDILTRFFETGAMRRDTVQPSLSPSMDIQISSNFERYLCELFGRDHKKLAAAMATFSKTGRFDVAEDNMSRARRDFKARRCSDDETIAMIRDCYEAAGILIDPHTAVGLHTAAALIESDPATPMVTLACAHPAKFPDAVERATGIRPPVPPRLQAVMDKAENLMGLPNALEKVSAYIRAQARA